MREIEEVIIREYMYNDHFERMRTVKKNFTVTRIFNIYITALFWLGCMFAFYLQANNSIWQVIVNALMSVDDPDVSYFPFTFIIIFIGLPIAVLSFMADSWLKKGISVAAFSIYFLTAVFSVLDLLIGFMPMKVADLLVLLVYSVIGMWTEDFAIRSYKELNYLAGQEGFPDFNFIIDRNTHSKFVKYRDRWLKADKAQNYYTDNETPLTDYNVISADAPSKMDGISVDDAKQDNWFEGKKTGVSNTQGQMMDSISHETELPDYEYTDATEQDERRISRTLPPL